MRFLSRTIDKRIAAYQGELLKTHYAEVENMYRQIRGWRHDYRNHIQIMKGYAAVGDMDSIRTYLDALDTDLQTVDTVIKTGNKMTDAILNSKISLAKSRGITVVADAGRYQPLFRWCKQVCPLRLRNSVRSGISGNDLCAAEHSQQKIYGLLDRGKAHR